MNTFLTLKDIVQLMLKELEKLGSEKTDWFKYLVNDFFQNKNV
jgi:hypothetical protein